MKKGNHLSVIALSCLFLEPLMASYATIALFFCVACLSDDSGIYIK